MTVKKTQTQIKTANKLTEDGQKKRIANFYLSPEVSSAAIMDTYTKNYTGEEVSFENMIDVLKDTTKELTQKNSMEYVERLLLSQAIALNNLFTCFARRASFQENHKWYETHMRFALKAQSQSRATLETLAAVKNPPVVFAKNANIATNQQINNGAPPAQPKQPKETLTHEQSELLPTQTQIKQEVKS